MFIEFGRGCASQLQLLKGRSVDSKTAALTKVTLLYTLQSQLCINCTEYLPAEDG